MKVVGWFFHFTKDRRKCNSTFWGTRLLQIPRMIKDEKFKAVLVLESFFFHSVERFDFSHYSQSFRLSQWYSLIGIYNLIFFLSFCGPFKSRKSSSLVWNCFLNHFVNDFLFALFQEHIVSVLFSVSLFSKILFLFFLLHSLCPGTCPCCKLMDMKKHVQVGRVLRIQEIQLSFSMSVPFTQVQVNGFPTT